MGEEAAASAAPFECSAVEEGEDALRRSLSISSSAGSSVSSGWTLLNAQGSEIESCSCQTSPGRLAAEAVVGVFHESQCAKDDGSDPMSSSCDTDYSKVAPATTDSDAEELPDGDLDSSGSTVRPAAAAAAAADVGEWAADSSIDAAEVRRVLDLLSRAVDERRCVVSADYDADALPVNFVQMCSDRIRNYMHRSNARLNWKLSLLLIVAAATVIGLGCGHFIGTTWLRRHRVGKQQLEQLKSLQDDLIGCLGRLHTKTDEANACMTQAEAHAVTADSAIVPSCHPEANAQQSRALSLAVAKQRRANRQALLLTHSSTKQEKDLSWHRRRLVALEADDEALRATVRQLEDSNDKLVLSLLASERRLRAAADSQVRWAAEKARLLDAAEDGQLLQRLKRPSSLTDLLSAYTALFYELDIAHLASGFANDSSDIAFEQLDKLRGMLTDAMASLGSVEDVLSTDVFDEYFDGAKDLSQQVGSALSLVWEQTKAAANTLQSEENKQQVSQFVQNLGVGLDRVGREVFDKLPDAMRHSWSGVAQQLRDTFALTVAADDQSVSPVEPVSAASTVCESDRSADVAAAVDEFRRAVKHSSLASTIGQTERHLYVGRLKSVGKVAQMDRVTLDWWRCQQSWWSPRDVVHVQPFCRHLAVWQHDGFDAAAFMAENPSVAAVVGAWSLCSEAGGGGGEERSTGGAWLFRRAAGRHEERGRRERADWQFSRAAGRREERAAGHAADWLFERGRERAHRRAASAERPRKQQRADRRLTDHLLHDVKTKFRKGKEKYYKHGWKRDYCH